MTTDWRGLIAGIEPRARLTTPATDAEIAAAEQALGVPFPDDLKDLYRQTGGVLDDGYGPLLPLADSHTAPFVDSRGRGAAKPSAYSVTGYTQRLRTEEFARLNGWDDDITAMFGTFVVLGVDIGGDMFGFFDGSTATVGIRSVSHDTTEIDETVCGLEAYLRRYFAECPWFEDTPG